MGSHWRMFERIGGSSRTWHLSRNRQSHMTTTIASPTDRLRAALKQAGFNARRVSVRHDHSTLRVTIRDASASLTQVEAVAGPFESVRRCVVRGELPARRPQFFHDPGAYRDWRAGRPFNVCRWDRDMRWMSYRPAKVIVADHRGFDGPSEER